jgi:NDP-sugar pyrophosphorylase family protein
MDFAIIAAGEGSRLKAEGFQGPKPMVKLQGLPMIHRLITIFIKNKAERIFIIINEQSYELEVYLNSLVLPVPLKIIKKTTPSSLHSFYQLTTCFVSNKVCLTTVDSVFNEEEFSGYITAFKEVENIDALMAVTTFVDDESPLYVTTDAGLMITGFEDENRNHSSYVSGGIYCFRNTVFDTVKKAVDNGTLRMRNFQRILLTGGLRIKAHPFSKIIDVDHVRDITLAEKWLGPANTHSALT